MNAIVCRENEEDGLSARKNYFFDARVGGSVCACREKWVNWGARNGASER